MISVDGRELRRAKAELLGLQAVVKFRRFLLAFKYNDNQPRDERGRFAETGETAEPAAEAVPVASRRDRSQEAACEEQYALDRFQCAMVGLASCYNQAKERYVACLFGKQIPPLNY